MTSGRESFFKLPWSGQLQTLMRNDDHFFVLKMDMAIEDAWQTIPEEMASRIIGNVKSGNQRSALWEMFVWMKLTGGNRRVEYETDSENSKNRLDFKVTTTSGYEFFVEAKSFGPSESDLVNETTDAPGEIVCHIRSRLKSSLKQIKDYKDKPVILAFANSFSGITGTKFQFLSILFGKPGVRIHLDTNLVENVITDLGFYLSDSEFNTNFDGVIFHDGFAPGFSTFNDPCLWLNPNSNSQFDFTQLGWEMDIYKAEGGKIWKTNLSCDFKWLENSIY